MKIIKFYFKVTIPLILFCCTNSNQNKLTDDSSKNEIQSDSLSSTRKNDEQEFQLFLKIFSAQIKNKNADLSKYLNFPFYTSQKSINDNQVLPSDSISYNEFNDFKGLIFNEDVIRLFSSFNQDNLSEIDVEDTDSYYQTLRKKTDPKSRMYEVYFQYQEKNSQSESYNAFVLGKINGRFKALSYYGKWPVK